MSNKQPMLSFAKVVSGAGESTNTGSENLIAISGKIQSPTIICNESVDKEQDKIIRKPNNKLIENSKNQQMTKNRTFSRNSRNSDNKSNETSSNIIFEPAPIPIVNAWFKQKSTGNSIILFLKNFINLELKNATETLPIEDRFVKPKVIQDESLVTLVIILIN